MYTARSSDRRRNRHDELQIGTRALDVLFKARIINRQTKREFLNSTERKASSAKSLKSEPWSKQLGLRLKRTSSAVCEGDARAVDRVLLS